MSANILKTVLSGWIPTAINFARFQALTIRMFSPVTLASEWDRTIRKRLDDGSGTLWRDARGAFPDPQGHGPVRGQAPPSAVGTLPRRRSAEAAGLEPPAGGPWPRRVGESH